MVQSRSLGNSSSRQTHDDWPHSSSLNNLEKIGSSKEVIAITNALELDGKFPQGSAFLVGGVVRDLLINAERDLSIDPLPDLDIAIPLTPEEATKRLTKKNIKVVPTGVEHGTISVVFSPESFSDCFAKELQIQLTTFRQPGERVSTKFSKTIEEDLEGRDFTINAIAYEITNKELVDPFDGMKDLQNGILRAVKDPTKRFKEDPLRILRMIRFGAASGRKMDQATLQAAGVLVPALSEISEESIRDEFTKLLFSRNVREALFAMRELKILDLITPEVTVSYDFPQNEFHTEDVFSHTATVVERAPATKLLRLAAFFHDLGKPSTATTGDDGRRHFYLHEKVSSDIARDVMTRLKYSNEDIKEVMLLVNYHMRPLDCGAPGARRLIRDLGDSFNRWRDLKIADSPPIMKDDEFSELLGTFDKLIETERNKSTTSPFSKLAIDGNDVMALGIPAGPKVGQILKDLLEAVADNPEINNKTTLLEMAKKSMLAKCP